MIGHSKYDFIPTVSMNGMATGQTCSQEKMIARNYKEISSFVKESFFLAKGQNIWG